MEILAAIARSWLLLSLIETKNFLAFELLLLGKRLIKSPTEASEKTLPPANLLIGTILAFFQNLGLVKGNFGIVNFLKQFLQF